MKKTTFSLTCLAALFASNSFASVILTQDHSAFQSAGISNVVSDFEEFNQSGFGYPSDPMLQGGISYNNTDNLIINDATSYTTNGTNMLVNNWWNPVEGSFYEEFSLFGFDAGWSSQDDNGTTITIDTNLSSYVFDVDFDIASSAQFYGFIADEGEYFTSFNISSNNNHALNAIDNVAVGSSASVSEPAIFSLFASVFAGLALLRRRKQA